MRIDANTGDILGEYLTAPDGMGRNPSRTTVDQFGNVSGSPIATSTATRTASQRGRWRESDSRWAERVWTRTAIPTWQGGYLAPPFAYNTCLDRDGDGLIRTSSGLGDILAWTNDAGADTEGGVTTAEDECIINYVRVPRA